MKKYVIGYAFNEDLTKVVLVKKNRPDWQAGKLNGVGGKVEENESFSTAIYREFEEEAGVPMEDQGPWNLIATFTDNHQYKLHVFACKGTWVNNVKTVTDEEIVLKDIKELVQEDLSNTPTAIFNVSWSLLMARQMLLGRDYAPYYSIEH